MMDMFPVISSHIKLYQAMSSYVKLCQAHQCGDSKPNGSQHFGAAKVGKVPVVDSFSSTRLVAKSSSILHMTFHVSPRFSKILVETLLNIQTSL